MNTSAFEKFLDEKFIPLSIKAKGGILLGGVLLVAIFFYFVFFQPKKDQIASLEGSVKRLENELKIAILRVDGLEGVRKDMAEMEKVFLSLSDLLPKEKEIPQLLKDISALGHNAGLDFNTFKPEGDIPQDFYKKIPITIKVRGSYHSMGYFFDQVSKMERIVSVTNVRMASPQKEMGEMLLQSDCKLLTYQFSNTPLAKPKKTKK